MPDVRRNGSVALRAAALELQRLAHRMEDANRPPVTPSAAPLDDGSMRPRWYRFFALSAAGRADRLPQVEAPGVRSARCPLRPPSSQATLRRARPAPIERRASALARRRAGARGRLRSSSRQNPSRPRSAWRAGMGPPYHNHQARGWQRLRPERAHRGASHPAHGHDRPRDQPRNRPVHRGEDHGPRTVRRRPHARPVPGRGQGDRRIPDGPGEGEGGGVRASGLRPPGPLVRADRRLHRSERPPCS